VHLFLLLLKLKPIVSTSEFTCSVGGNPGTRAINIAAFSVTCPIIGATSRFSGSM
jgi:hypothetical protein